MFVSVSFNSFHILYITKFALTLPEREQGNEYRGIREDEEKYSETQQTLYGGKASG